MSTNTEAPTIQDLAKFRHALEDYFAIDRPYHGHFYDDVGDEDLPEREGDAAEMLAFCHEVAKANPTPAQQDRDAEHLANRVDAAIEKAEDAFWQVIGEHFPEAKSGDFSPEQTAAWNEALRDAVEGWVANNAMGAEA